jgi:hypothetical protein
MRGWGIVALPGNIRRHRCCNRPRRFFPDGHRRSYAVAEPNSIRRGITHGDGEQRTAHCERDERCAVRSRDRAANANPNNATDPHTGEGDANAAGTVPHR